jgi:hypothetical protein
MKNRPDAEYVKERLLIVVADVKLHIIFGISNFLWTFFYRNLQHIDVQGCKTFLKLSICTFLHPFSCPLLVRQHK